MIAVSGPNPPWDGAIFPLTVIMTERRAGAG
jgi:hypothetical protein